MHLVSASSTCRMVRHSVACYLALVCAAPLPLFAQPAAAAGADASASAEAVQNRSPVPKLRIVDALEVRGDLSLQEATMEKALLSIAASWNVNIVVGKNIKGNVSCLYTQTPLREVLDAILLANRYSYRAVGESLVILPESEVGTAHPLFESASIPITHSDVQEIVDGARLLLSQQGELRALESAHSLLVIDYAEHVAKIQDFVARMDAAAARSTGGIPAESYKRLTTAYFHTQYIPVENAREPLTTVLSQVGALGTMPDENRLIVTDYASNIAMVKKILERIDRPLPQVRITALIYDISLEDIEQLGLNWNSVGKGDNLDANGDPQQAITFDSTTLTPFTAGAVGGTATIKSLTRNFDITTVALLLQRANDARLLANPNVTVMENTTAEMKSVEQIPFQQLSQSELGGQLATTAFKDVGITLSVTPSVAADGTVRMIVSQEFSRVAGFTENDNQPIVDTRVANTTVRVGNRQTLVIAGLRQRSDTGDFNGIPFLKDVRYIGPLFRSRSTNVRESELVVFLMPEIVAYDEVLSQREFMAQETVNCRLDRVPMAEGCAPAGRTNFGPGGSGTVMVGELVPLPPVGGQRAISLAPRQGPAATTTKPFRQGFEDRYRASGGTDARGESARKSSASPRVGETARSTALRRIFGL